MSNPNRHIRDVLDADTVDSSNSLRLASTYIEEVKSYLESAGYTAPFNPSVPNGGSEGAWIAVWNMGDDQDGIPPNPLASSFETPSVFNHYLGFHPFQHGVDLSHTQTSYGDYLQTHGNSALRHLNNMVQFGKGASSINGSIGGNFMSGGTNLPDVSAQQGTYNTVNFAMSDFRGVEKNDVNNPFVHGDSTALQVPTAGPISVGSSATDSGGQNPI